MLSVENFAENSREPVSAHMLMPDGHVSCISQWFFIKFSIGNMSRHLFLLLYVFIVPIQTILYEETLNRAEEQLEKLDLSKIDLFAKFFLWRESHHSGESKYT